MENKQIYAFTAAIVVSVIVAVSIWFFQPFKSAKVSQTNSNPTVEKSDSTKKDEKSNENKQNK
ncbi:hypothetical protein [Candidatus Phytoplasma solani]|uniref:hypothetical protein n=1 Tax=Candidatus Phytoplasma solani TaxID=69896 RepID=UPI0032DB0679